MLRHPLLIASSLALALGCSGPQDTTDPPPTGEAGGKTEGAKAPTPPPTPKEVCQGTADLPSAGEPDCTVFLTDVQARLGEDWEGFAACALDAGTDDVAIDQCFTVYTLADPRKDLPVWLPERVSLDPTPPNIDAIVGDSPTTLEACAAYVEIKEAWMGTASMVKTLVEGNAPEEEIEELTLQSSGALRAAKARLYQFCEAAPRDQPCGSALRWSVHTYNDPLDRDAAVATERIQTLFMALDVRCHQQ